MRTLTSGRTTAPPARDPEPGDILRLLRVAKLLSSGKARAGPAAHQELEGPVLADRFSSPQVGRQGLAQHRAERPVLCESEALRSLQHEGLDVDGRTHASQYQPERIMMQ